jgi:hypothetical protein
MMKTISAVAVAAIAAAIFVAFPSLSFQVEARTPASAVKSDRLDIRPLGVACSEQAWPYIEGRCLRDQRAASGQVRTVRQIAPERPAGEVALAAR